MTKGLNPTNKTFVFFFNPSPQELLFLRSLSYTANAAQLYKANSLSVTDRLFGLYTRGESNPNRRNRNPLFYPLNYGCRYKKARLFLLKNEKQFFICVAKVRNICSFANRYS